MTVLAAGAISITDGAIVIAAETVAPRLGLKPEALQAEMQRGQVCCLVETGVDEDEGRTRARCATTRGRGPWSSTLTAKSGQRHGARAPSP